MYNVCEPYGVFYQKVFLVIGRGCKLTNLYFNWSNLDFLNKLFFSSK